MAVEAAYRILVLGGYGQFGRRIVQTLAAEANCHVIIAGRHMAKAAAAMSQLRKASANLSLAVAAVDAEAPDLTQQLVAHRISLVIHTAGPFLHRHYRVARACIEAGVNYIDLADNREFVLGIGALDEAARARGVLVVSGASTVPALSSAVVDEFAPEFTRIDRIDIGITPGSRAPRGRSTIESVLTYCGKPYLAWQAGRWRKIFGWQDLHPVQYPIIGTRWFANCDIPDLEMFPQRYRVTDSVTFAAALELRVMQFSVWLMSWLTRAGLVRSWIPVAGWLKAVSDPLDGFGTDRGGMHVHIDGLDAVGKPRRIRWFLIAQHGDGPMIPCIASIVLARKLARGELRESGAKPCVDMMTLQEFQLAVRDLHICFEVL